MRKNKNALSHASTQKEFFGNDDVSDFYDRRVNNTYDLNTRIANGAMPVYHHSGLVHSDMNVPKDDITLLTWLYKSEETLTDFVWYLLNSLSINPLKHILDVGCGEGATLNRFINLSEKDLVVSGITVSEKQRTAASELLPKGTWVLGDMREAGLFTESQFDAVLAIESTEYIGRDSLPQFVKNSHTWLKPEGLLIIAAGSWADTLSRKRAEKERIISQFNNHYLTKLSSTGDYISSVKELTFRVVASIDLSPAVHRYWKARAKHPILQNSAHGHIEKLIEYSLSIGAGEYRFYVWRKLP